MTDRGMDYFRLLGSEIEDRWRRTNYDELCFPDLAVEILDSFSGLDEIDSRKILANIIECSAIPFQVAPSATFGDPGITVYHSEGFFIDLLYWLDGTTSIHQHAFSGAFRVIEGSSIHSTYSFGPRRRVSSKMCFGDITLTKIEWLQRGHIRRIDAGERLIHSLFHLDRPSVTLVVRTTHEKEHARQFDYFRPSLALDAFGMNTLIRRKLQCLKTLFRTSRSDYLTSLTALLQQADLYSAFLALQQHNLWSRDSQQMQELVRQTLRSVHGDLCLELIPVLDESRRQESIVERRNHIQGAEHRFLLACLLNAPDRNAVLELIRCRHGMVDPSELVATWVEELVRLPSPADSREPNALGIEMHDDELFVFRKLASGQSNEQILATLESKFDARDIRDRRREIAEFCDTVRELPLFRTLFAL